MGKINVRKRGKVYEYFFERAKVNSKRTRISKSGFRTQSAAYEYGLKAYNDYIGGEIIPSESNVLFRLFGLLNERVFFSQL